MRCLKDYVHKSKIKNYIKCPLCRHHSYIPKGGVDNLIDNYFLTTSCVEYDPDGSEKELVEINLPDFTGSISEESGDDVTVPFSLLMNAGFIQTKFKATFVSAFTTGEERCINSIYPVSEREVWTISDCGPDLVLFDIHGQEVKRLFLQERFCDMVYRGTDILICMPDDRKIGHVSISNGQFLDFAFTGHCRIYEMSSFPDGSIVVVGPENVDARSERRGKIQIFSQNGEYLAGHAKHNDDFEPIAVAVNPILGTFSVVDSRNHFVYTLLRNGDILSIYNGGPRMFFSRDSNPFIPGGICYDLDGNLIIVDRGSGVLHVLNSFGKFLGLVLTNHEGGFGQPFSVAVDKSGKLWIGDYDNGMISVFKISSYINEFGRDDD